MWIEHEAQPALVHAIVDDAVHESGPTACHCARERTWRCGWEHLVEHADGELQRSRLSVDHDPRGALRTRGRAQDLRERHGRALGARLARERGLVAADVENLSYSLERQGEAEWPCPDAEISRLLNHSARVADCSGRAHVCFGGQLDQDPAVLQLAAGLGASLRSRRPAG